MAIALVLSIAAAVLVYVAMIGLTRAVTTEDMELIPHGEKIGRILRLHSLEDERTVRHSLRRGGAHLRKKDR